MKLDPRIIEGKTYLDCYDTEIAKKFIGKECYLSDGVASFANIDNLNKATLLEVDDGDMYPYKLENTRWHYGALFILPCEWVQEKEPKWRAFKDHAEYKEFLNDGIIESWVKIKDKSADKIYELMYVGGGDDKICLGGMMFSVSTLFNTFELFNESTEQWQPFGVLAEGDEK